MVEYLNLAETHQDFLRRQGALQAWMQVYSLVESLVEVNKSTFEEYVQNRMETSYEEMKKDQPELAEMLMGERQF